MRAAAFDLDTAVATTLEAMATRLVGGSQPAVPDLDGSLLRLENSVANCTDAVDKETAADFSARLALYRAPVGVVKQVSLNSMTTGEDINAGRVLAAENTLAAEPK